MLTNADLQSLHLSSRGHRELLATAALAACFHCGSIFPPAEIREWTSSRRDQHLGPLTACTDAPRRPVDSKAHEAVVARPLLVHDSASVQQLSGTLLVSDPVIGQPGTMVTNGGLLWVTDRSGNPAVHAIDLATGAVVSSEGRAGEGPGDFASISNLSIRPGDTDGV